ncbi:MAG: hypothetical protein ABT940_00475 [Alphaproteobacteria bacterium]
METKNLDTLMAQVTHGVMDSDEILAYHELMGRHGPALVGVLVNLYGQVAQAKEGFGIYCDSPSMAEAMHDTEALITLIDQEATCQT